MLKSEIIHLRKINNKNRGRFFLADFKYVCFVLIFERLQVRTCEGKIQNDARKFCQKTSSRGLRMYWLVAGFWPSVTRSTRSCSHLNSAVEVKNSLDNYGSEISVIGCDNPLELAGDRDSYHKSKNDLILGLKSVISALEAENLGKRPPK